MILYYLVRTEKNSLAWEYCQLVLAIFPASVVGALGNIPTEPLQEEIFVDPAWRGRDLLRNREDYRYWELLQE